ncbi:hypothetical protein PQE70_gp191 [Bacillus phage vB_BanS_Nate]|uniref:Uncharacterized protein n=1 Tax=Bacillus phage vB_BanS_Nate TaxID=2894788 RepID=A0AAE9CE55_9CAUD|nr:hypothetical protein PQE70_gp191 [Bacillus phage vB_BanS_Nate]UGO51044.1 hypothetical protein NATE_191 [Bacillus phage vB_BanS_Nate]
MKVLVTAKVSDDLRQEMLEIVLDDAVKFSLLTDEDSPESNRLGSPNLEDVYDIPVLLLKAYEAGKRGEEFTVEYEREERY